MNQQNFSKRIMVMAQTKWILVPAILLLSFLSIIPAKAGNTHTVNMTVGETTTLSFSTSQTVKPGSMHWWSNRSSNVQVVSYNDTKATVKAIGSFSGYAVVRCDYYYYVLRDNFMYQLADYEDFYVYVSGPSLTVSPTNLNFTSSGGSNSVTVASATSWSVSKSVSWLTVSPTSGNNNGTVSVTAAANTGSARIGAVTITGGGVSEEVYISQASGLTYTLTVSPASLSFTSSGESKSISVTSNSNWSVSRSDSWITVSPASGSNNGTVSVTAAANTGSARNGTVTITGGGITQTVSVSQAAAPAATLTVSPASLSFASSGESKSISVTSNTSWSATESDSWLTVSPASGSNNGTVSVTAAANTGNARTCTVTFTGGGITRTVSLSQAATPASTLTVSPESLSFTSSGESKSISVTSNTSWSVTKSDSWLTVSPASGSNNGTVSVTAAANTGNARTGTVTFTGGGITRTVSLSQAATPAATLTVSPASLSFTSSGESKSISVTSNTSWSATKSDSWLTVSPASGSNNGTVSVTAAANTGNARNGTVTITGGGITQTVSVSQDAGVATWLDVSPNRLILTIVAEDSKSFTITSNTSWSVSKSDSWMTVSPASGSNNGTVTVTTAPCNTGARFGTVTITGGGTTRTVVIEQSFFVAVSPASLSLAPSGGSANITVTSFASQVLWNATSASWLTLSSTSEDGPNVHGANVYGIGNGTITVTATENTGNSKRTGVVSISDQFGNAQMVSVTQEATPAATLTVSPASLSFASSGESKNISVTSNTSWSVDKDVSWLTVSPTSGSNNGTIDVTAVANTTTSRRTGTVTISGGGIDRTVSITQAAYVPPANALTVSPATLDFTAAGETKPVTVTSNVSWTVDKDASWLTVSQTSGTNNGAINVTAAANTTTSRRTGTVTITGGSITRTISITQAAYVPPANTLTVSTATLDFTATGETKSVTVTSNVSWTVDKDVSWLTVSPASGSNNGAISITATANNTGSARTGTATVSGGGLNRTIAITQAASGTTPPSPTLTVSTANVEMAADGGSQSITIQSNTSWTAVGSEAWVSVSPASGANNGMVNITATANATGNIRTATVTITAGSLTHIVAITQAAAQQQVEVEPEQPEGGRGVIDVRLQHPVNERFTVEFIFHLPAGFILDREATSLITEWLADYELLITPNGANSWRFVIRPKTAVAPRTAGDMTSRQLLRIVYAMDETVGNGNYEMSLNDIDLTLNSGQTIHQDEINVSVRVDDVGNDRVGGTDVRYFNSRLYVNTPVAERIAIYSLDGRMIYQAQKQSGIATFNLYSLPRGVLIVRGDSGWVKKIIK